MPMSYDYLWEIYQKEKQTNQLLPISKTFYADAQAFINKQGASDEAGSTAKTNSVSLLNNIFEKRRQKILIYLAYGKALPQPVSSFEQDFYDRVNDVLKVNKLDGTNIKTADRVLLKSLKDMPEVILPSGNKAGPFQKNQTIELGSNESDIKFLLDNAICESV